MEVRVLVMMAVSPHPPPLPVRGTESIPHLPFPLQYHSFPFHSNTAQSLSIPIPPFSPPSHANQCVHLVLLLLLLPLVPLLGGCLPPALLLLSLGIQLVTKDLSILQGCLLPGFLGLGGGGGKDGGRE